ncbi:MAG: hypothetical protein SFU99_01995 [Saprospiraceae bacterium]|nr:hypothetical protein [Saprospiraceae bacterium]
MKKLFLVLFLFAGLSLQSFASIGMEKMSVTDDVNEYLQRAFFNDSEIMINENEAKNTINTSEVFECWIHNVHCDCGFYVTQYCNEGLHGTIQQWEEWICGQSECNQPEP